MSDEKEEVVLGLGGPNPELYARLSKPYLNRGEADHSLNAFLLGVQKLREECGIAEALVIAGTYFDGDEKETVSVKALAMGSPEMRAQLGALAYQQYTLPEIERAERLAQIASGQYSPPRQSRHARGRK